MSEPRARPRCGACGQTGHIARTGDDGALGCSAAARAAAAVLSEGMSIKGAAEMYLATRSAVQRVLRRMGR